MPGLRTIVWKKTGFVCVFSSLKTENRFTRKWLIWNLKPIYESELIILLNCSDNPFKYWESSYAGHFLITCFLHLLLTICFITCLVNPFHSICHESWSIHTVLRFKSQYCFGFQRFIRENWHQFICENCMYMIWSL